MLGPVSDAIARIEAENPIYIPRNHLVEEALSAATEGDMAPFMTLLARVQAPFTPVEGSERYALPATVDAPAIVTFCGT